MQNSSTNNDEFDMFDMFDVEECSKGRLGHEIAML